MEQREESLGRRPFGADREPGDRDVACATVRFQDHDQLVLLPRKDLARGSQDAADAVDRRERTFVDDEITGR